MNKFFKYILIILIQIVELNILNIVCSSKVKKKVNNTPIKFFKRKVSEKKVIKRKTNSKLNIKSNKNKNNDTLDKYYKNKIEYISEKSIGLKVFEVFDNEKYSNKNRIVAIIQNIKELYSDKKLKTEIEELNNSNDSLKITKEYVISNNIYEIIYRIIEKYYMLKSENKDKKIILNRELISIDNINIGNKNNSLYFIFEFKSNDDIYFDKKNESKLESFISRLELLIRDYCNNKRLIQNFLVKDFIYNDFFDSKNPLLKKSLYKLEINIS